MRSALLTDPALVVFALGVILGAVLQVLTFIFGYAVGSYEFLGSVPVQVLSWLFRIAIVVAIVARSRESRISLPATIGASGLALIAPVVGLIAGSQYNYLVQDVFGCLTSLFLTVAWLVASRSSAPAYRVLWIAAGATVLSFVAGRLGFVLALAVPDVLSAAGTILAIFLAPRLSTRNNQTYSSPSYGAAYSPVNRAPGAGYAAAPAPMSTTNGFAIAALIMGLLGWTVLPIIFGHIARSQIRQTGQGGWGMATAGLVLGYICAAAVIVIIIAAIAFAAQTPHYYYG